MVFAVCLQSRERLCTFWQHLDGKRGKQKLLIHIQHTISFGLNAIYLLEDLRKMTHV